MTESPGALLGAEQDRQRDQHKRRLTEIQGSVIYECGGNLHHEGVYRLIGLINYMDFWATKALVGKSPGFVAFLFVKQ